MLTRDQVEAVLGRLDDLKLAEILDTGASPDELLEAKRWLAGYLHTVSDDAPVRNAVVTRVCDILGADEPEWYEQPG
jgi:hypothetical protein